MAKVWRKRWQFAFLTPARSPILTKRCSSSEPVTWRPSLVTNKKSVRGLHSVLPNSAKEPDQCAKKTECCAACSPCPSRLYVYCADPDHRYAGAELIRANTSIEQEVNDRPIPISEPKGVGTLPFSWPGIRARVGERVEQDFYFRLRVRDDVYLLRFRPADSIQDLLGNQMLFEAPGPQRGKPGVVIEQGFLTDFVSAGQKGLDISGS